jgi:hypothetical protein
MRGKRRVRTEHRVVMALWAVVAVLLVLVLVGAARGGEPRHGHACTHGVSSVGPVVIANGNAVGGSTTPHTEACLP